MTTRDRFFRPTCSAPGFNLPNFLDQPELSVKSVKPEVREGDSLVRVEYVVRPKDPKLPTQRAWCLLEPDRGWRLREFETNFESASSFTYSGVVSYDPGSGPEPKPKSMNLELRLPASLQKTNFIYDRFNFQSSPAGDFSLAAYGLEEVDAPPARGGNSLPYWLGGIAAVTFVLSVWLRIHSKRRTTDSTRTT